MNFVAAIVAGLSGTIVITIIMALGPKMGMPKMDMPGMLGSMFGAPGNRMMGLVMHLMMGSIFAIIYAFLWDAGYGSATLGSGALFGVVHFLIVGMAMGMMPLMHAGIKSGDVPDPGFFMLKNGGLMGFMGGLVGHVIFGLVVALVYGLF